MNKTDSTTCLCYAPPSPITAQSRGVRHARRSTTAAGRTAAAGARRQARGGRRAARQPANPRQRQRDAEQRQPQVEQRDGAVTPACDDETLVAVRAMRGKDVFAAAQAAQEGEGCVEDKGPEQQDAAALCQRLRNCSGVMPACLRIARNVPSGISPG